MHITSDSKSKSRLQDQTLNNQYKGLSRSVNFLSVVKSSALAHIQIVRRYPSQLFGGFIQVMLFVVFFGFFATAVTFNALGGKDVFLFFLGGLLLVFFTDTALYTPLNSVTRDLYNGTLEAVYFNPASRYGYYVGFILGDTILLGGIMVIPIFSIIAFISGASLTNLIMIMAVSTTTIVSLIALGVLFSLLVILWKQVGSLMGLIGTVMQFLTGAFIPVKDLPEPVQVIAYLMPQTYGMDLVRYYSFGGDWSTILPVELQWLLMILYAIIYTFIAFYLLKKVEMHAKTKGLHLI